MIPHSNALVKVFFFQTSFAVQIYAVPKAKAAASCLNYQQKRILQKKREPTKLKTADSVLLNLFQRIDGKCNLEPATVVFCLVATF